jgi:hypothetical protein
MSGNNRIGIGSILLIAWVVGSLLGVAYGLFLILGGLCLLLWVWKLAPHARDQEIWKAARNKFDAWKKGQGPKPTLEEFQLAANYYMMSDAWDYRLEDLSRLSIYMVPNELRPFFESERMLRRRWREDL